MSLRRRIRRAFEDPTYPTFRLFNIAGLFITIGAVVVAVLETEPWGLTTYPWLPKLEMVFASLFASEYALRLWSSGKPIKYMASFYGLVDFISFAPTFLVFGNLTFLKTARALRVIRFIRLARLAKVTRLETEIQTEINDEDERIVSQNVRVYIATLISSIVVVGTLAHAVEPETFSGALSGSVWAISEILGGGLVEETVSSPSGKAVAILARFSGFVLFGFLINVVAGVIKQTLLGKRE